MQSPNYPHYAVKKLWAVVSISAIVAKHLEFKGLPAASTSCGI
jgi:hypothetical protein